MDSIQSVTRRGATCSDLLSCLYNLKPIDMEVLIEVAKNRDAMLTQIAELVHRDRSSTHRCLSKLVSAGLVHKQSKTLEGGGYYHVYSMTEPAKIKAYARQRVQEITDSLERLIENFESDLNKHLEQNEIGYSSEQ